ncbi:MAPEG family protein [Thalassotalea fusca]
MEQYYWTNLAIFVGIVTLVIQTFVAMRAHRKQTQYIPGIVNEKLGHESFVFRSHRTYQNSLENVPLMFFTVGLAMIVGVAPHILAILTWVFVIARIIHMVLYYKIATEKNPSPRSYFFLIAFLANVATLFFIGGTFLS